MQDDFEFAKDDGDGPRKSDRGDGQQSYRDGFAENKPPERSQVHLCHMMSEMIAQLVIKQCVSAMKNV